MRSQKSTANPKKVRMKVPGGQIYEFPESAVQEAKFHGAEEVK